MTAAAPTPDRPEGGWRDGDAVMLDDGFSWRRRAGKWRSSGGMPLLDGTIDGGIRDGRVVYVHAPREPEPVMPPLPTEQCAIRATVRGVEGVVLVGPNASGGWCGAQSTASAFWHRPDHITAWEPLLSRAEWEAGQDGDMVRVPKMALEDLQRAWSHQHIDGTNTLVGHLHEFLTVVSERGDQA